MITKNTKPSSVHMAQPIYPRKIQSILDKRKNCSAIGKMEITLVWAQKERCTLIFKSLLEWPGLFDLSYAVLCLSVSGSQRFHRKALCLYCVQDNLFCQIVLFVMSCFVRVAHVMIHGLNVKKHSCGFGSGKNGCLMGCWAWFPQHIISTDLCVHIRKKLNLSQRYKK